MTVGELMLYDFIKLPEDSKLPLYRQLYTELRSAIINGLLLPGEKIRSIRAAAAELKVSRMTVETAYQQLCLEGYLQSQPQRGYFVASQIHTHLVPEKNEIKKTPPILYNFNSRTIDIAYADLHLWQKYMRQILSQEEILISYGEAQGELSLREALAAYCFEARGVRTTPEQIIIGAGIQPLLTLLCGLLTKQLPFTAGIESPGFPQAEQILADFNIPVIQLDKQLPLPSDDIDLYIYLAARAGRDSFTKELTRRRQLITWREAKPERYILEDDYNGELRFLTRPIPALQSFDKETIFLGSFSKLLLPSVRIAYMAVPDSVAARFREKAAAYNQTAGKVEQLALAEYIRTGRLERHLRRLRKLYHKKAQAMELAFHAYLGDTITYELWETELRYLITFKQPIDLNTFTDSAASQGIAVTPLITQDNSSPRLMLSFAGIPLESIDKGINQLAALYSATTLPQ